MGTASQGRGGSGYRGMRNPTEAKSQVYDLARNNPDFIKIIFDDPTAERGAIDRKTLEAAIQAAHDLQIRVIVHIGTWKNAEIAAKAKADAITHFYDDEEISPEALQAMKEFAVVSIPTFAVQTEMGHLVKNVEAVIGDSLLQKVSSLNFLNQYKDRAQYSDRATRWAQDQDEDEIRDSKSIKQLARAGITLLAGSDAGNIGVFQGYSVHREMELWTKAGISTWDALSGATTKAAEFLGIREGFRPGDEANFLILSRSPLEDIRATREIEGLIFKGRLIERSQLISQF